MKLPLTTSISVLFLISLSAIGTNIPLQEASINRIINDVRIVQPKQAPKAAKLLDVIKDDVGVKTGVRSRCELIFQDQTLTRLGSETYFSFKPGTREMSLSEGTMLLQVPKDQGGATIRTASITASITGTTVMLEHRAGKSIKFLVLEGSMRVGTGRFGESISLTPGKMLIMDPKAKRLPDPVNIDLKKLIKTSSLVNPDGFSTKDGKAKGAMLPSMPLINQAIKAQELMRGKGELIETNLAILGKGTRVMVADEAMMESLDSQTIAMNHVEETPANAKPMEAAAQLVQPVVTPPERTENSVSLNSGTSSIFFVNEEGNITDTGERATGKNFGPGGTDSGSGGTDSGGSGPEPVEVPPQDSDVPIEPPNVETPLVIETMVPLLPNVVLGTAPAGLIPDRGATASATAGLTIHTRPVASGALPLINATIDVAAGIPMVSYNGTNYSGTTYSGAANDGSASWFLFGGVTDFDAHVGFDTLFGYGNGTSFPESGVSVFKGTSVSLGGQINVVGTEKDIALVAENSITTAPGGFTLDVSNLRSVTLATQTGNVVLARNSSISATGENFQFLHLYGRRGTAFDTNDSIELSGSINLPNAALIASGAEDVSLRSSSVVTVNEAFFSAKDEVELFGTFNAKRASINAGNSVEFSGTSSIDELTLNAAGFEVRRGTIVVDKAVLNLSGKFMPDGLASMTIAGSAVQSANTAPTFTFRDLTINAGGDVYLNTNDLGRMRLDFSKAENFTVNKASRVLISGGQFNIPDSVNAVADVIAFNSKSSPTIVTGFDRIKTATTLDAHILTVGEIQVGTNLRSSGLVTANTAVVGGGITGTSYTFNDATIGGSIAASERFQANQLTVGGNVTGKDYQVDTAMIGGTVNTTGSFRVNNSMQVGGNLTTGSLTGNAVQVGGSSSIEGDLAITNFRTRGSLAVGGAIKVSPLNSPSAAQNLIAGSFKAGGGLQFRGADGSEGGAGGKLDIFTPSNTTVASPGIAFSSAAFSSAAIKGANFDGGDASSAGGFGGNGGILRIGTNETPFGGSVAIDDKISAVSGKNGRNESFGGNGGTVQVTATGKIALSKEISVSGDNANQKSRSGGNILLESRKTFGTAIEITSSAQLNALLAMSAPGDSGKIELKSAGGLILANGGKINAGRGTVDIQNTGLGNITLNNTDISANVIKAQTHGADGTLTIGGGQFNANTLLSLYASGSNGKIKFTDNTALNGSGLKFIAANTVTIADGKRVTVGGLLPASVFTNNPNFTGIGGNGSTTGAFDGRGAVVRTFRER